MKHLHSITQIAMAVGLLSASSAQATDYIVPSLGWYDVTQQDNEATLLGLEYRMEQVQYNIRPMVGIFATSDNSVYGYVGAHWDVSLMRDQLYLSPNFAVGAYRKGDGKPLGGTIEFRSGIELAYQMQNQHRIGVAFNHLSNASMYDRNPGVETLLVNYSLPTGTITGR